MAQRGRIRLKPHLREEVDLRALVVAALLSLDQMDEQQATSDPASAPQSDDEGEEKPC